ncbi:MAG: hypothetical protein C0606_12630 [Hyphomicrobiales bacterium]|nr:MAG: hypothetical protein C0606_12630 [Hyphomicrobiales bacterium]
MRMDDTVWERHASGWSVWSRFFSLPLMLVAIWSHVWIGTLAATILVAIVLVWTWLNPRLFNAPGRTDAWHARATFGERVWLNRNRVPIPRHHALMAHLLALVTGIGAVIALWSAFVTAFWPMMFGTAVLILAKLWFLDRMVWLYEDMKLRDPVYRSWTRTAGNDNGSRAATRPRKRERR